MTFPALCDQQVQCHIHNSPSPIPRQHQMTPIHTCTYVMVMLPSLQVTQLDCRDEPNTPFRNVCHQSPSETTPHPTPKTTSCHSFCVYVYRVGRFLSSGFPAKYFRAFFHLYFSCCMLHPTPLPSLVQSSNISWRIQFLKLLVAQFTPGFVKLNSPFCTVTVNPVLTILC